MARSTSLSLLAAVIVSTSLFASEPAPVPTFGARLQRLMMLVRDAVSHKDDSHLPLKCSGGMDPDGKPCP